jgi:hypothetical protein
VGTHERTGVPLLVTMNASALANFGRKCSHHSKKR